MVLAVLAAILVSQGAAQQPPRPDSISARPRADSATRRRTSIGVGASGTDSIALTPELEANAYRDAGARHVLERARATRAAQDSALQSYRASAYQRMSVGSHIRALGRERLIARAETAMQIEWQRDVGARITIEGSREAAPLVSPDVKALLGRAIPAPSSVPYYPGRESLWPMGDLTDGRTGWTLWRHPLRPGAEAYYRYETGDSIDFVLPDRSRIRLVEIRLEPRRPRPDLVAGSFWFDLASGQLVRALYRPSVPMELRTSAEFGDSVPFVVRALAMGMMSIRPLSLTVNSVVVEFALQEGRWWLPVQQSADAEGQVTFVRVPARFSERFSYSSVNGLSAMEPITVGSRSDSLPSDSTDLAARRRARVETCRTQSFSRTARRRADSLAVEVRVPCDTLALVRSPALPASIFDPTDVVAGEAERELLLRTLGMRAQASFGFGKPSFAAGLGLARYNRIEGLSLGTLGRQQLGGGYSAELGARLGTADLHPRGELTIARQDAFRTISLTGFERLGYANEWGSPLTFGASVMALVFGRDEGLYYRTTGVELSGRGAGSDAFAWRAFAERHDDVDVETHASVARLGGKRFRENIDATPGEILGAAFRLAGSWGENPLGWRSFGDIRVEGATGDFDYARAMADATVSFPLVGAVSAALTGSGGSSVGGVPTQRLWYLGGTHTIRGQPMGAASGDAFWMGRAEIGLGRQVARVAAFYDAGWAGDRSDWRSPGRPLDGAGMGVSVFDGLLRLDVARGLTPNRGWRGLFLLDARF